MADNAHVNTVCLVGNSGVVGAKSCIIEARLAMRGSELVAGVPFTAIPRGPCAEKRQHNLKLDMCSLKQLTSTAAAL